MINCCLLAIVAFGFESSFLIVLGLILGRHPQLLQQDIAVYFLVQG